MLTLQTAWRNLRARGWRLPATIGLLAAALAANAIVFSAADSLIFRRITYPEADRLITFDARDAKTGRPTGGFASPELLDEWREQSDLFSAVHGHLYKTIFLTGSGEPELVPAADVTVGLVEMLGIPPEWGRSFIDEDARRTDVHTVLLAEATARERFGHPLRAVGQNIATTAEPLIIVGVMPATFRFPDGTTRIWRVFDPRGALARNIGISAVARAAPHISMSQLSQMMQVRSPAIYTAAGARSVSIASPAPLRTARVIAEQRRMLLVLLGAAASLLLAACANTAGLELAGALVRVKTYAIQLAIGASRADLVRAALVEGFCLLGGAALIAAVLAHAGLRVLVHYLPPSFEGSLNPIDFDGRALIAMAALATIAWLLSSLPVVIFAARADLLDVLKVEAESVAGTPASTLGRRALTVAQMALAVMLLVGSVLYVRSYLALVRLDTGFDTSGVVAISLTIPPQLYGTAADRAATSQAILERLRGRPGVIGAFEGAPPPSTGDSPMRSDSIEVDDKPPMPTNILLPRQWVDPEYFRVLGIPLVSGRMFEPTDPPTNVLITEALATRLWPGENAVGHRFREQPGLPWNYVIGVVRHVRTPYDAPSGPERYFQKYSLRQLPPPPAPSAARTRPIIPSGMLYGGLSFTARVDSRSRAADLYQTVRSVDPRNILKVEFVDDRYARQFADRLLTTRIITSFGVLTFLVATAGIYALMAFLVTSRAREIGIRMALGADSRRIRQLVLGSSMRLVLLGAVLGIAGAIAVSKWMQSQLFGVSSTDPLTIALVTIVVMMTALLATWHPAHVAGRIDPRVLVKN